MKLSGEGYKKINQELRKISLKLLLLQYDGIRLLINDRIKSGIQLIVLPSLAHIKWADLQAKFTTAQQKQVIA